MEQELVLHNHLTAGDDLYDKDFDWTPYAPRRHISSSGLQALKLSPLKQSPQKETSQTKKVRFRDQTHVITSPETTEMSNDTVPGEIDSPWWTSEDLTRIQLRALEEADKVMQNDRAAHHAIGTSSPSDNPLIQLYQSTAKDDMRGLESLIFPMLQNRRRYTIRLVLATQRRLGRLPPHLQCHLLAMHCRQTTRLACEFALAVAQNGTLDDAS